MSKEVMLQRAEGRAVAVTFTVRRHHIRPLSPRAPAPPFVPCLPLCRRYQGFFLSSATSVLHVIAEKTDSVFST